MFGVVYDFEEEDYTSEMLYSSYHIKDTYISAQVITVHSDIDYLAGLLWFLAVNLLFFSSSQTVSPSEECVYTIHFQE